MGGVCLQDTKKSYRTVWKTHFCFHMGSEVKMTSGVYSAKSRYFSSKLVGQAMPELKMMPSTRKPNASRSPFDYHSILDSSTTRANTFGEE